jgi:hypothetical protein
MNLRKVIKTPVRTIFRIVSRINLIRNYRYIFILGHMRSGSTLLAHILASHPDIVGAGEMHISYHTPADLPKLILGTCKSLHKPILREPYIVDQINHEYVAAQVLLSKEVHKCVILLREPEGTLKSMLNLSVWDEKQALNIYVNRLETLTQYASLLRERAMLVEYDDLIDHADETLATLTSFIGLDSPLTPSYATHRMTGRVAGYGDPSDNIKIGRIVRTPKHELIISRGTQIAAANAFRKCRRQLRTSLTKS